VAAKVPETRPSPGFPDSSFKYTPLRHVRVLFIRFCQGLFFSAPPGCYHWEPDDERSEILITNENRLDPELINKRPGLHFTRGPCQFYSLGIDDRVTTDFRTDGKEKGVLVPGSMTINVVSRVQQEAEDLAWVVAEHIWLLRDLLMKAGFFEIGRGPQIGSPSQAGTIVSNEMGDEFYVTPVSIPWQFARNSKFTPLGKQIVSSIEQSLSTTVTPIASQGWRYHPHEYPVNITETQVPSFAPQASDSQGATPNPTGSGQDFLPKQPHPLKAGVMVSVRTVRPFRQGLRLVVPG
jgi:hypothetical protein